MTDPVFKSLDGQLYCLIQDSSAGLKGFIVIDSSVNSQSAGGLRMIKDANLDEVKDLARGMTLKSGFLGLPKGGAKSAIVADIEKISKEKKMFLLKRFAEIAKPLVKKRVYGIGADMNTSQKEVDSTMHAIGEKSVKRTKGISGYFTALSVFIAAIESAKLKNIELENASVAIEGFGSVGLNAAKLFHKKGSKIIALSTHHGAIYNENGLDIEKILQLQKKHGNKFVLQKGNWKKIPLLKLLELKCDMVVPCGRGYSINEKNASKIKAKIVCPGSNSPVTWKAEKILHKRKILSVPFFVSNCGGRLGNAIDFTGVSKHKIESMYFAYLSKRIQKMLKLCENSKDFPRKFAENFALKNFEKVKKKTETKTLFNKIFWNLLQFFKKSRLIPQFIVAWYAEKYFKKLIQRW